MAPHLGAHLCRCTGYVKILDAIEAVAKGKTFEPALAAGVGQSGAKYEAAELALGDRGYVDDIRVPGMLHAALHLTAHARADVTAIDTDGGRRGRRRGRRVHGRRHPRRAARRDHLQGLAGDDPGRRAHVLRRRRARHRRRRDPPAGPRRGAARRRRLRRAHAGHRSARRGRARRRARRVGHRRQRAVAQRLRPRRRRRRAGGERPHDPRGLPDPAHRARLPRAGVHARRAVGDRRRQDDARLLGRPGRVGRPRRHLPHARPPDRPRHRRARLQRRRLRRQGGHEQPGPRLARRVAARPAGEVHALARGELPHARQAAPDPPRVLGRLRRRRDADRRSRCAPTATPVPTRPSG